MEFFNTFCPNWKQEKRKEEKRNASSISFIIILNILFQSFRKIISNTPCFWNWNRMWIFVEKLLELNNRYTQIFVTWSRSTGSIILFKNNNNVQIDTDIGWTTPNALISFYISAILIQTRGFHGRDCCLPTDPSSE